MRRLEKTVTWILTAVFSAGITVTFFCFIIKAIIWSLSAFKPEFIGGVMAAVAAVLAYQTRDTLK